MDAKDLNQALYDKMAAEQEQYKHNLLGQTPAEVLNHAYEYAMREDILMEMETLDLTAKQAAALLESPSPLADVYKDFRDMETGHMDTVRECIEERADALLEAQRKATRSIPFYQQPGEYAREHGELEIFRASRKANEACRDAIDAAIRDGYDGMNLTADAKGVLAEFGSKRVSYVLAATIQDKTWDQRISRSNQAWAAAIPMVETEDRRLAYLSNSHPALLDGFVNMVRKELDVMQEQPEQAAKKPSIQEQPAATKEKSLQQETTRVIPIYYQSGQYAREHGELEAFRASRKAHIACRDAIETVLREDPGGMSSTTDIQYIFAEFGPERVSYVLAATLQSKPWDDQFSRSNHAWAETIPMLAPKGHRSAYIITSDSRTLDFFINNVRKELDVMREQPEQAAKKPFIRDRLVAARAEIAQKPNTQQRQKDKGAR